LSFAAAASFSANSAFSFSSASAFSFAAASASARSFSAASSASFSSLGLGFLLDALLLGGLLGLLRARRGVSVQVEALQVAVDQAEVIVGLSGISSPGMA
jgi:hypothetical protein